VANIGRRTVRDGLIAEFPPMFLKEALIFWPVGSIIEGRW
jgi:hypothetical protein